MPSTQTMPADDVLIQLAAISLRRLWEDEERADRIGDRIEQDLLRLTPRGLSRRGRGRR